MYKKIICNLLISLLLLLISILIYYYFDQVKTSGETIISNKEISSPISIYTDKYGLVHISTETRSDAFFALGVAHARDRLFQMEILRRMSSGRLSEIFGEKLIKIDKYVRTIGFRRAGEKEYKELINNPKKKEMAYLFQKYCDGINYWKSTHYKPLEFYLLGINFDNWTIADSQTYFRFMEYSMSGDFLFQMFNHVIHDICGNGLYKLLYNTILFDYPYFNETYFDKDFIISHNLTGNNGMPINIKNLSYNLNPPNIKYKVTKINQSSNNQINPIQDDQASNSWLISGKLTNTGKPIFSNDPHLHNYIPNTHYLVKLYIGKKDKKEIIVGSAPTCVPMIFIGNNDYLAYGFATDYRNRIDLVEEKLDDVNIDKAQYYYIDNIPYKLDIIEDVIKIKGKPDYKYKIKLTKNGPILDMIPKEFNNIGFDFIYNSEKPNISNAISINFYSLKKEFSIDFIYSKMFAKKSEDFLKYSDTYIGPPFSLSWATVEGEIGYTPVSNYVVENNVKQIFKKGYISKEYNSDNIYSIPKNETPVLINPDKGYIVTANSHVFDLSYKYYSTSFDLPFRTHRIIDMIKDITKHKKFSINDSIKILSSVQDDLCMLLNPSLVNILERNININNNVYKYLTILKNFDCNFNKESIGATVYEITLFKTVQLLLTKKGEGFKNINEVRTLCNNHVFYMALYNIIKSIENKKELNTLSQCKYYNNKDTCEMFLVKVFNKIEYFLNQYKLLQNNNIKKWGKINKHYQTHVLDKISILKKIFAREISTDGNKNTPKVAKHDYALNKYNPFTSVHSANFKYISDLSDISRPYVCLDNGNSGNILSKYYDNLMERCEKNDLIRFDNYDFTWNKNNEFIIKPN